jgi:hypothetical protein
MFLLLMTIVAFVHLCSTLYVYCLYMFLVVKVVSDPIVMFLNLEIYLNHLNLTTEVITSKTLSSPP